MTQNKPRVFLGSASESLDLLNAVQGYLRFVGEVTPWPSAFDFQKYPMDSLETQLESNDFAVFVFSPDDLVNMRKKEFLKTRDNTVFELGLYWGRYGRDRVFFIIPDDQKEYKLPSDLDGLNTLTYDNKRSDGNYSAAVSYACGVISAKIKHLGKKENLKKKNDNYYSLLTFFNSLCQKLWKESDQKTKYEHLFNSFSYNYRTPNQFRVSGASIWKANNDGIGQIAGDVGKGKFYRYRINNDKDGNKIIYVVDSYLNNDINFVLFKDGIVKTYLICYPIANKYVFTVHLDGQRRLSDSEFKEIFDLNDDLLNMIHILLGGATL